MPTGTRKQFPDWDQRWFGYWRVRDAEAHLPRLADFIDPTWQPEDKKRLIDYLRGAPLALATCAGFVKCLLCSRQLELGSHRSDGTWLWPDDLAHYVEEHEVRLPTNLEQHIRDHHYRAPEQLEVPVEQLPWPP
jgi:hypothetical protein